ncbi:MAG: excinuclease ABC subunit UvrC, partial [Peptostreptococcaceae bacterium]|nr:excinuclease ABC subunit UvrC [Peptostreptococcaceae bacterium]
RNGDLMNCNDYIKNVLKKIPDKPGVYLMKDLSGEIIYVGKAISLKKRVRQYFGSSIKDVKVLAMVSNIDDIEFIVTNNEMEALMLENNLIKKNKPFYNILLRDDKSFPYIKVTNDLFPRILKTRNKLDKDGLFFGPYTDVLSMNRYLRDINEFFKIRDCSRNIERSIENKERPCLNYHIGICSAPCANKISRESYQRSVQSAIEFLKGNHEQVRKIYQEKMLEASKDLRFEDAAEYRDRLSNLQSMKERQSISIKKYSNRQHYIANAFNSSKIVFTIMIYEDGNMVGREYYDFDIQVGEISDIFTSFLMQYYTDNADIPKEVYLEDMDLNYDALTEIISSENKKKVQFIRAKIGKKREILELAKKNSEEQLHFLDLKNDRKENQIKTAISELEYLTGISSISTIESYDISNISGSDPVGVKIVYKDGKRSPSDYRKYRVSSREKPDDYSSTAEVIERRLKYGDLPDIILLDGGKGHVSTIKQVLKKNDIDVPVFGMYKNEKHQTEGLADEDQLYEIGKNTRLFRFLSEIQNEVHRFAINYHRRSREKNMIRSELDSIKGIGEKRKLLLLKRFGGIEGIKNATQEELSDLDGMDKRSAAAVFDHFQKKGTKEEN